MFEDRQSMEILMTVASSRHGPAADAHESEEDLPVIHDHFRDADGARQFLEDNRVAIPRAPLTPAALADLRRLRQAVLTLQRRDSVAPAAGLLRRAAYRLDVDGGLSAVASGWPGFISRLLPALVELRTKRGRLKVCANPACRWLFLDRSKNHARIWCDMAVCGNRAKVKRFFERRRA
jgi:hypothetical protein